MAIIILFPLIVVDIVIPMLMFTAKKTPFVNDYLQSDETILTKAENSVMLIAISIIIIALINIVAIIQVDNINSSYSKDTFWIVSSSIYLLLIVCLFKLMKHYGREFVVTNKRIIIKKGLVSRYVTEYRYDNIESFDVKQSILGRMFGYGSIIIHGIGGRKTEEEEIQDPFSFRQHLIDKIV